MNCVSEMFPTDQLKIEVDPCKTTGWNEFQAVKLYGSPALYAGVIKGT